MWRCIYYIHIFQYVCRHTSCQYSGAHLHMHPTMRSSNMEGTRVGVSRVPLGPAFTDMLNGSCDKRVSECVAGGYTWCALFRNHLLSLHERFKLLLLQTRGLLHVAGDDIICNKGAIIQDGRWELRFLSGRVLPSAGFVEA